MGIQYNAVRRKESNEDTPMKNRSNKRLLKEPTCVCVYVERATGIKGHCGRLTLSFFSTNIKLKSKMHVSYFTYVHYSNATSRAVTI